MVSYPSDQFSNLTPEQDSIYAEISLDLVPYRYFYPEVVRYQSTGSNLIGYSEEYVIAAGQSVNFPISLFPMDSTGDIIQISPGWQTSYMVSIRNDTMYAISTGHQQLRMDLYIIQIPSGDVLRSVYVPSPSVSPPIPFNDTVIISLLDGNLVSIMGRTVVWGHLFDSMSTGPMYLSESKLLFGTSGSYCEPQRYTEWNVPDSAVIESHSFSEPMFVALNPETGAFLWNTSISDHVADQLYVIDGIVYASLKDGSVIALDTDNGSVEWQEHGCVGEAGRFAVNEDYLICSSEEAIRCLDPDNGKELWRQNWNSYNHSVGLYEHICFVIDYSGSLTALDADTGDILWLFQKNWSSGNSILVNQDFLYATSGHQIICINLIEVE